MVDGQNFIDAGALLIKNIRDESVEVDGVVAALQTHGLLPWGVDLPAELPL